MSEVKLSAQPRSEFGKGAARRLRQANQVPAVLYGHGTDPVHVALPGHDTMLALKQSNVLLSIDLAGKSTLALAKDVQRNALKGWIEHVDLLIVRRGEKVTVEVPLTVVGDAAPGTLVTSELNTLSVEAEATHIPQGFEVNVEGLEAGQHVTAGQIELPQGATLVTDADAIVVVVAEPRATVAEEAAEGEGGEAAAEAPAEES
ncbi:50S ribosomal protein L25/general stress protein Ctc [Spongisporangium articulatum]|uniref:Large ribosomal subunit protein bL25 n=1 Tax=Spongisporangium articulatum TaxID=3362603 RepID=A0ABW8AQV1_9ACTN